MSIVISGTRLLFVVSALSLLHCSEAAAPTPDNVAGSASGISPQNPFAQLPANTFFGPCPNAIGNTNDTHHYTFTLYALGVETLTGTLSSVKNVDTAIQAATPIATAKLTGESNAKPD
jgi:phosphatidylethanolamine-binding protein (PEBP) family uncharacterized protein